MRKTDAVILLSPCLPVGIQFFGGVDCIALPPLSQAKSARRELAKPVCGLTISAVFSVISSRLSHGPIKNQ
ncbi:hypothetical protein GCM10027098_11030 [Bowmanella dokdonensis]